MTNVSAQFKTVLEIIGHRLLALGYSKRGSNFILRGPDAAAVVNVQKSKDSSGLQISFVLNGGVSCELLSDVLGMPKSDIPTFGDSQIHFRIEGPQGWWNLPCATNELGELAREVIDRLEPKLEILRNSTTLTGLKSALLNGDISALTDALNVRFISKLSEAISSNEGGSSGKD